MLLDFLNSFWNTLCELAPWLLLGMLLSGALHVALPRDFLQRHLSGRWGVLRAVVFGIPLPLCSCGVLPTGIGLHKDGASRGAAVGFLISTPQTGVDSILVCAALLGWPFALFKVAVAMVLGCVGGWLTDATEQASSVSGPTASRVATRPPVRELLPHAMELLRSIWLWMLAGLLIAALLEAWVPDGEAAFEFGTGYGAVTLASLATLLVSVPLYVCATSSVPIAAALVSGGFPLSTAVVFLIAGPATNVGALLAIGKNLGLRATVIYLGTIVVGTTVSATLFAWVLTGATAEHAHLHDHAPVWWQHGCAGLLMFLMGWCALERLRGWAGKRRAVEDGEMQGYAVEGMSCQNCADRLGKALRQVAGVESAAVDLQAHAAYVGGDVQPNQIEAAIRECGFQPEGLLDGAPTSETTSPQA